MEDEELLTVAEVARRLSLSRSKVYELISAGDIPSIHIGRARRVAVIDLDHWITRLMKEQRPVEENRG